MTISRQIGFWLAALVCFILFLWYLQDIILPFIAGFVLAYFLDPVADRLEKFGLPRIAATALILLSFLLVIVFTTILVVPVFADTVVKLAANFPALMKQLASTANDLAPQALKDYLNDSGTDIQGKVTSFAGTAAIWLAGQFSTLLSGGRALINTASIMIITPIVAFYLLADWDHLVAQVDAWLPRDHAEDVRAIARDVDQSMAGYIRGQGMVCIILALFYAIGLYLVGLKSGLAIGMATGLMTFIPYVGALLGGATAIGVGLLQFWPDNEVQIFAVLGVFAVGQFLEGNFLAPKLVGGSIGLHPVWMMFALFAFSYIFGIMGLLLAVPMAATTAVFVRHGIARYLRSKLYTGSIESEHD
jgi:predicted PurR-regulated permease PerM